MILRFKMISVCNIMYTAYPPLPRNQILAAEVYCELEHLEAALNEKHPSMVNRSNVIFHQLEDEIAESLAKSRQKLAGHY